MREHTPPRKQLCLLLAIVWLSSLLAAAPVLVGDSAPVPGPDHRPSVALVLGGGGAKGFSHVPILSLLQQMDIPIDMIIGTSIGAIVGGIYAAGYSPAEIMEEFAVVDWPSILSDTVHTPYEGLLESHSKYALPLRLNLDYNFSLKLGKSIATGQYAYQLFRALTLKYPSDLDFDQLEIPFRAIATDALTGEAYILRDGDLAEAIRASMSLPGVFDPFEIDGVHYMDGGLRYNLAINVAKDMGYDIIIAVDLSQQETNPANFDANPLMTVLQAINITQQVVINPLYEEATVVISPNIHQYDILDFLQAQDIYNAGEQAAKDYFHLLEDVRRQIYPQDYDPEGRRISSMLPPQNEGSYSQRDDLVISEVRFQGELASDRWYLQERLARFQSWPLTQDTLETIAYTVHLTGNYRTVKYRTTREGGRNVLTLHLNPRQPSVVKLALGVDFRLSTSNATSSQFNLSPELQLRGLTGNASVIALRGTFVDDLGGNLFYFQPIFSYLFVQLESDYHKDNYVRTVRIRDSSSLIQEFSRWRNTLTLGFRTPRNNLLKFSAFHHYLDASSQAFSLDSNLAALLALREVDGAGAPVSGLHDAGARIQFVLDFQEKHVFSEEGFYGDFWTKVFFPLKEPSLDKFAVIAAADMRYSVPIGAKFTLEFKGFLGFDVMERMMDFPSYIMLEGFHNYDRIYFPQIVSEELFGLHKVAAGVTLQFKPFKWLTLFGGDLFLRINGNIGTMAYRIGHLVSASPGQRDDGDPGLLQPHLMWSSSVGVGMRIADAFTINLRGGAGSTSTGDVTPFFSVDIGSLRF